ncbi:MAG: ABC transporter permease [Bacillota bacterium]|nr:ABC transporter permease [Bacillota bacterium]
MKTAARIYTSLIFAFLYLPILVLIIFSFNSTKTRTVWNGFTFDWYIRLFHDGIIITALRNTLIVAVVSSVIATVIGTIGAVGIDSLNLKMKKVVMQLTNLSIVNPEIVTGVAMMLMFVFLARYIAAFQLGYITLILAHITFCIPYVILSVMPKLRQMEKYTYEAALDLYCNPLQAFFRVILPEIMPGVITGMIIAFTLSIDDFVISYFTSGPTSYTLPIVIYSMTRKRVSPEINALSTLLFVTVLALLLIVNLRQSRDLKKTAGKGGGSF